MHVIYYISYMLGDIFGSANIFGIARDLWLNWCYTVVNCTFFLIQIKVNDPK